MSLEKLFRPLKLGHAQLSHRLVIAPLTRFRADAEHNPNPLAKTYYEQRATRAGGYKKIPGIYTQTQIEGWKEIVNAVHAKGSPIYLKLWALGRVAQADVLDLAKGGPYKVSSASAIAVDPGQTNIGGPKAVPVELSEDEIQTYIKDYASAAANAIEAGFDGVEIHGANGYLIDQFWQDVSNQRTDKWGGNVENRSRFGLEVTKAVIAAVGDSKKVAMRLSSWGKFQGMRMQDPVPQFEHIIKELRKLDLAYLHLIESRVSGNAADGVYHDKGTEELKKLLTPGDQSHQPFWLDGSRPKRPAFGRYFISTPDLPYRIKHALELNKWDRQTFDAPGPEGYIDYAFSEEYLSQHPQESRL